MSCRLEDSYTRLCVKGQFAFLASKSGVLRVQLPTFTTERVNTAEASALAVTAALDVANNDGRVVEVWRGDRKLWAGLEHVREVTTLGWNDHDSLLASGSADSRVLIWDMRQQEPTFRLNTPAGAEVHAVSWCRDNTYYLAAAHDTAIKLWDVRLTMKSLATVKKAHATRIETMNWHPTNPSLLLTAGKLATLRVWTNGHTKLTQLYHKEVRAVAVAKFTPYGDSLLYAPSQSEVKPTILSLSEDMRVLGQLTGCRTHLLDFDFAQLEGVWYVIGLGGDHTLLQLP